MDLSTLVPFDNYWNLAFVQVLFPPHQTHLGYFVVDEYHFQEKHKIEHLQMEHFQEGQMPVLPSLKDPWKMKKIYILSWRGHWPIKDQTHFIFRRADVSIAWSITCKMNMNMWPQPGWAEAIFRNSSRFSKVTIQLNWRGRLLVVSIISNCSLKISSLLLWIIIYGTTARDNKPLKIKWMYGYRQLPLCKFSLGCCFMSQFCFPLYFFLILRSKCNITPFFLFIHLNQWESEKRK